MNKFFLSFPLIIGLGLFATGCGSSSASLACESNAGKAGHACIEASATGEGAGSGNAMCPSGSTEVSSCPTANEIGNCSVSISAGGASATSVTYYYSDSGVTADAAKMSCEQGGGTWTAAK
jgi:hypothetical protein